MALTTKLETFIVVGLAEGKQEIVQSIPLDESNYRTTQISANGEYFFLSYKNMTIYIYRSCFYDDQTYYYGSDGECVYCNSTLDMFI